MIIKGRAPGEQICWSEPWTGFSARTGADRARILAAADRNGGRAEWGLRELIPGRLHAGPAVLLERLLPAIIKLLNELMAATPVEDLSGVALKPERHAPPQDRNSPFGERERLSIRWQLGF